MCLIKLSKSPLGTLEAIPLVLGEASVAFGEVDGQ
jgi:hypothetical protein